MFLVILLLFLSPQYSKMQVTSWYRWNIIEDLYSLVTACYRCHCFVKESRSYYQIGLIKTLNYAFRAYLFYHNVLCKRNNDDAFIREMLNSQNMREQVEVKGNDVWLCAERANLSCVHFAFHDLHASLEFMKLVFPLHFIS